MRSFIFLLLLSITVAATAQTKWYVAYKRGLSIREKANPQTKVLGKIPYGAVVSVTYPDSTVTITTAGLQGSWTLVSYNGLKGYIVNSYLLPYPPPKEGVKTMKGYLAQLSAPAGAPLIVKKGTIHNIEEGGSETKKQLFKNGTEYHSVVGYEWNNDTYFLPDFTMEQGFVLLQLLPEFRTIFTEGSEFPRKNVKTKKGSIEYDIKVESETIGDQQWIKRMTIEFADGSVNTFEMFQVGNQLVISFGGGV